jgi:hypothetical protein
MGEAFGRDTPLIVCQARLRDEQTRKVEGLSLVQGSTFQPVCSCGHDLVR